MTRRAFAMSERACALAYGREAADHLAAGRLPGFEPFGAPGWWVSRHITTELPDWALHPENYVTVVVPRYRELTTRVSVENGPVIWEDA